MRKFVDAAHRNFSALNTAFFVVLGHARTGTNLLCSMLNSHPGISCAYEVLHPDDARLREQFHRDMVEPSEHWLKPGPGTERSDAIEYIESKLLPKASAEHPYGPKILYWQVHKLNLFSYLARQNFSFLHMKRSPVEIYVSQKQAEQTDQWYLGRDDKTREAAPAIEVELSALTDFCHLYQKQFRRYNRISPRLCAIDYAELCKNPQREMDRVFHFLGVQTASVDTNSRKQQSWDIRERISNFDDLLENATEPVLSQLLKLKVN